MIDRSGDGAIDRATGREDVTSSLPALLPHKGQYGGATALPALLPHKGQYGGATEASAVGRVIHRVVTRSLPALLPRKGQYGGATSLPALLPTRGSTGERSCHLVRKTATVIMHFGMRHLGFNG